MRGAGGDDVLWAKAAELERQFEGYKRRLPERRKDPATAAVAVADRPDGAAEEEDEEAAAAAVVGRGRRYDAYVRRRDEKLRQGWRARMERKEAEMKALWAHLAAGHDKEQKPGNLEVKPSSSSTPRSSSAMKASLSRARTPRGSMPSPAGAAASPRLSSTPDARRRAPHREPSQAEPPSTPRKENRVPSAAAAATATTPRLRTLSRSRSSLKEPNRSSFSVMDSPRRPPPRLQSPRPSHAGGAGDRPKQPPAPAPTAADAVAQGCRNRQVVIAEIKTAAASRLRRSGNGAGQGQPAASPRPVITKQVDGRRRPSDTGKMISRDLVIESNNFNINDDDTAQSSVELGGFLKITGDSDTEPSYVYIKKDSELEEEAMTMNSSQAMAGSGSNAEEAEHQSEKETGDPEEKTTAPSDTTAKESPATDQEDSSPQSSDQSFYSNVDSSFSHRSSELAASPTDSPLHGSPSSTGPSTEQLLEADAAMLRKRREEEEDDDATAAEIKNLLIIPGTTTSSSSVASPVVAVQSPTEAVAGLKRFLTFGKKNGNIKAGDEVTAAAVADDDSVGERWRSGDSGVIPRICSSDAASDDSDNNYVIPAHVRSLQSCVPCSPARPVLLKELISSAKSPRAHRSFFSFSSFKSRGY
ncbi:treacle protein-like [Oryza brachyantha]|uniref:treacle protein-like n=1 Tax=Oryza brachyantha TaxID=4533 RepID=UPI001ADC37CF|nr:treacle protein-like [Oryza brachyantha]